MLNSLMVHSYEYSFMKCELKSFSESINLTQNVKK